MTHASRRGAIRAALLAFMAPLAMASAHAETITIGCGSSGTEFELCKKASEAWAKKTGHTIKIFTTPSSVTDTLALYRQMFASKASEIDVMMVDVVWPGILKDHLTDLKPYTKGVEAEHFPASVANNTIDGKLLALPLSTNAGLLYYRTDLLEKYSQKAPTTWDEMAASAKIIQDGERKAGNKDFQGFVFQGKAYEGLTCVALEWVSSYGGGTIVERDGRISINNPRAIQALSTAASWVNTISPQGVLNYSEEEARGVFQPGNAAFMRNWNYAWALVNGADSVIKGKVGVSALPKGGADGRQSAALGDWSLGVPKYSKNPALAADLLMFLSSRENQKARAIAAALNPTIVTLYKDKEILAANPFMGTLYDVFSNATPRPSTVTGTKYNEVSAAFWNATHDVLSGKAKAEDSYKRLEGRLTQIRRGKTW